MKEKEKARELIDKMYAEMKWFSRGCAKKCAIICCDEIIEESLEWNQLKSWKERDDFWQAVKKELIK